MKLSPWGTLVLVFKCRLVDLCQPFASLVQAKAYFRDPSENVSDLPLGNRNVDRRGEYLTTRYRMFQLIPNLLPV